MQNEHQKKTAEDLKKWNDFLSNHRHYLTATELSAATGFPLDMILEHIKKQRWKLARYRAQAEALIRQHEGKMSHPQLCELIGIEQVALIILIKAFREKDNPPAFRRMFLPF